MKLPSEKFTEYVIIADLTSKVIRSFDNYKDCNAFAAMLRQAGAQITMFKSLNGKKK